MHMEQAVGFFTWSYRPKVSILLLCICSTFMFILLLHLWRLGIIYIVQIYQVVRKRIINEGFRVDGRQLDEVRPVYCEAGSFPILHGSSIFNRGDTQVSIDALVA